MITDMQTTKFYIDPEGANYRWLAHRLTCQVVTVDIFLFNTHIYFLDIFMHGTVSPGVCVDLVSLSLALETDRKPERCLGGWKGYKFSLATVLQYSV